MKNKSFSLMIIFALLPVLFISLTSCSENKEKQPPSEEFTISFDSNLGILENATTITQVRRDALVFPLVDALDIMGSKIYNNMYYYLTGWLINSVTGELLTNQTRMPSNNIVLFAQWTQVATRYITFESDVYNEGRIKLILPEYNVSLQENTLLLTVIQEFINKNHIIIDTTYGNQRYQGFNWYFRPTTQETALLEEITKSTVVPQYDITIVVKATQTHRNVSANISFENLGAYESDIKTSTGILRNFSRYILLNEYTLSGFFEEIKELIEINPRSQDYFMIKFSYNLDIENKLDIIIEVTITLNYEEFTQISIQLIDLVVYDKESLYEKLEVNNLTRFISDIKELNNFVTIEFLMLGRIGAIANQYVYELLNIVVLFLTTNDIYSVSIYNDDEEIENDLIIRIIASNPKDRKITITFSYSDGSLAIVTTSLTRYLDTSEIDNQTLINYLWNYSNINLNIINVLNTQITKSNKDAFSIRNVLFTSANTIEVVMNVDVIITSIRVYTQVHQGLFSSPIISEVLNESMFDVRVLAYSTWENILDQLALLEQLKSNLNIASSAEFVIFDFNLSKCIVASEKGLSIIALNYIRVGILMEEDNPYLNLSFDFVYVLRGITKTQLINLIEELIINSEALIIYYEFDLEYVDGIYLIGSSNVYIVNVRIREIIASLNINHNLPENELNIEGIGIAQTNIQSTATIDMIVNLLKITNQEIKNSLIKNNVFITNNNMYNINIGLFFRYKNQDGLRDDFDSLFTDNIIVYIILTFELLNQEIKVMVNEMIVTLDEPLMIGSNILVGTTFVEMIELRLISLYVLVQIGLIILEIESVEDFEIIVYNNTLIVNILQSSIEYK